MLDVRLVAGHRRAPPCLFRPFALSSPRLLCRQAHASSGRAVSWRPSACPSSTPRRRRRARASREGGRRRRRWSAGVPRAAGAVAPAPAPAAWPRRTTAGPRSRAPRTPNTPTWPPGVPGGVGTGVPGDSVANAAAYAAEYAACASGSRASVAEKKPGVFGVPPPPRRASSRVSRLARNGARSSNSTRSAEVNRRGSARADSDSRPRGSARVSWSPGLVSSPEVMAWMRWRRRHEVEHRRRADVRGAPAWRANSARHPSGARPE